MVDNVSNARGGRRDNRNSTCLRLEACGSPTFRRRWVQKDVGRRISDCKLHACEPAEEKRPWKQLTEYLLCWPIADDHRPDAPLLCLALCKLREDTCVFAQPLHVREPPHYLPFQLQFPTPTQPITTNAPSPSVNERPAIQPTPHPEFLARAST
eukprot:CAMPEP_0183378246 /NCGR_PEP_ID=MMETSP0164_2-20130417/124815_1 /TAXON_ID=221442 /ORGANISM="Coccolithus pelagicus ssp braarudi, Strain PLY182g" /LENGTH=153 /DNA_ID=CAMNT_0025555797 /DNA_START=700 /DNA_END=1161 /DNA_ORIENTATION=+